MHGKRAGERVRELILEGVITLDLAIKEVANALWRKVKRGDMSVTPPRIPGDPALCQGLVVRYEDTT